MTDQTEDPRRRAARGQRATVLNRLNNGMLRLRTTDGLEVTGHAALDLRMALTRLLPGDAVMIELSPFDRSKARILGLARSQEPVAEDPARGSAPNLPPVINRQLRPQYSSQQHSSQQRELP